MDAPFFRYTVETGDGKEYDQRNTNDPAEALRLLCAFANMDGAAHLIDRIPTGDIRGFVLTKNT